MSYLKSNAHGLLLLLIVVLKLNVTQAQVPVQEEPRHHIVFENKAIRLLNVLIPPADTSLYHIHHTPSLFLFFTNTATGSQLQGRSSVLNGKSTAGHILFENLAPPNSRTHRVWNADKDTFHVIDAELLLRDTGFVTEPLTLPGLELAIDTMWVRAYRLTLMKGRKFTIKHKKQAFMLVSLDSSAIQTMQDGKTQHQAIKPGSFFFIESNHSISLKNTYNEIAKFILIELPTQ